MVRVLHVDLDLVRAEWAGWLAAGWLAGWLAGLPPLGAEGSLNGAICRCELGRGAPASGSLQPLEAVYVRRSSSSSHGTAVHR